MMRDVLHDLAQQPSEHTRFGRLLERRMAHPRPDAELAALDRQPVESRDAVDVHQMLGPREAERHRRHQALPTRQHAAVLGRDPGQQREGFLDGFRSVIGELRGLHTHAA